MCEMFRHYFFFCSLLFRRFKTGTVRVSNAMAKVVVFQRITLKSVEKMQIFFTPHNTSSENYYSSSSSSSGFIFFVCQQSSVRFAFILHRLSSSSFFVFSSPFHFLGFISLISCNKLLKRWQSVHSLALCARLFLHTALFADCEVGAVSTRTNFV